MTNPRTSTSVPGLLGRLPVAGDLLAGLRLLRDGDAPTWSRLLVLFAAIYVISPLDAIPDLAPFVSALDDLGVVVFVRLIVGNQLAKYRYPLGGAAPLPAPAPR